MLESTASRGSRLRVLVEAPVPFAFSVKEAARISDCDVRVCSGPLSGHACPLLAGQACPELTDADVVITSLGLDAEENRRVLHGIKTVHRDVPVVVLAWRSDVERYGDLMDGCHVALFPWTLRKLQRAVAEVTSPPA
jgi:hypothetical protein